eukprot:1420643-Alexandrium_andersonii.AAC.1
MQKLCQQDASVSGIAAGKQFCTEGSPDDPPLLARDEVQHMARAGPREVRVTTAFAQEVDRPSHAMACRLFLLEGGI